MYVIVGEIVKEWIPSPRNPCPHPQSTSSYGTPESKSGHELIAAFEAHDGRMHGERKQEKHEEWLSDAFPWQPD